MSMSKNHVQLIGNLVENLQLNFTSTSGAPVTNLRLATERSWKDAEGTVQKRTEFHRVVIFGKLAETCSKNLVKGQQVIIEGRLQTRKYPIKDKATGEQVKDSTGALVNGYQTEVVAEEVNFGRKPASASQPALPGTEPAAESPAGE